MYKELCECKSVFSSQFVKQFGRCLYVIISSSRIKSRLTSVYIILYIYHCPNVCFDL